MKHVNLIFYLMLTFAFGGFSQEEINVDSTTFETQCDCLKAEYLFKKEWIESVSVEEGKAALSPELREKHNITTWESLQTVHSRCYDSTFEGKEPELCPYVQKLAEMKDDFELIRRVLEMQPASRYHGNY